MEIFLYFQVSVSGEEKLGRCPPLRRGTVGLCVEDCSGDDDCPGNEKCCSNGCGHTCQEPRTI